MQLANNHQMFIKALQVTEGMGNLEKLRELEKRIDDPKARAAVQDAIGAIES